MKARKTISLILAIIGLLMMGLLPAEASPFKADSPQTLSQESFGKIDPDLLKQFENQPNGVDFFVYLSQHADLAPAESRTTQTERGTFVYQALVQNAEFSQREIRTLLTSGGFSYRPYYIANTILVRNGTLDLVYILAARSDVAELLPNRTFQLEDPVITPKIADNPSAVGGNIAFVNADDVWALGVDGAGIVVAANDTGLEWTHPAIISHYRGYDGVTADHNYNWWDPTGTYPTEPHDSFGHGTHVSGTMVGDDGFGNQIGMAPGAKTIQCKAMDDGGGGFDSWFLECFEWDLAPWDLNGQNPRPDLAPDAVNNSWGYWGGGNPVFQEAIINLQAAGILVEVSAGNEGPGCFSLRSPGDYSEVVTTGSVSWNQQTLPGTLSWFSSRGPSVLTPDFIPDVTAPGENIRSSIPGGGYQNWDGTSMAGPHVVGLIALMWSANPGLEGFVDATYQVLTSTTVPLAGQSGSNCGGDYSSGPNNDWGFGTIDSLAAVNAAMAFGGVGTLTGTVTDSASSSPLQGTVVMAELNPSLKWKAITNESGVYTRLVFSGTYTVSASLYGYYPQTVTNVSVLEDTATTLDFALDPAPTYTVSGRIFDALTGWPVYARIDISGYPYGSVFTDPESGEYSIDLAAGIQYTFVVLGNLDGYTGQSRSVGPLSGPQTEDFGLEADTYLCTAQGYLPGYAFTENFEVDDGEFTVQGSGSWQWGVPTSGPGSAHSGTNVWATGLTGNYQDGEFTFLVSPLIDMSAFAGEEVILDWWQWLQTEDGFDYASVEVSNDGGSSWSAIFGPVSGTIDTSWSKYSVVLGPAYAVSNLQVRFAFQSDGSVTLPGFYVDDVSVGVVYQAPSLYAQNFESNDGSFSVSGSTSWEWGSPSKGPGAAHSGANVWATSLDENYGNNEDGYLSSPVIDLSAAAGKVIAVSWWQWLQTESGYDFASVEVFNGSDWVEMIQVSGPLNLDWALMELVLDPSYAITDFQVRFRLQTDESVTYPGFYIDDVAVDLFTGQPPSVSCDPQSGGLSTGFVTDENTGAPLIGARVSSPSSLAFSIATPEDAALEDGFYTVFAPAGPQFITTTYPKYGPLTEMPVIPLNNAVRQDFALPAALLATDPGAITATIEMGEQVTLTVDLQNLGGGDTNFSIGERPGDFQPAALNAVWVNPVSEALGTGHDYRSLAGERPAPSSAPFLYSVPGGAQLSSVGVNVLLLASADVSSISAQLSAYPDLVLSTYDARISTPSLAELQAYDVVVLISNNAFADPYTLGDILADYLDSGGALVQTTPTFFDPFANGWGIQGRYLDEGYSPFIGSGDWFTSADLGAFDANHPIMAGVSYANDYFRQVVDLSPGAEWVASWTDDEFIATKDNVVALNTFIPDGYAFVGDIPLIVHNSILFAATGQDVPWLSTDPITGTLQAYATLPLLVTLDAGVPEITQPGSYQATLLVKNDGPYGSFPVPVSMFVNPPASWGRLSGSVLDLGYCDAGGDPLEGVAVEIQGVATTGTDAGGSYVYWMDSGLYTVIFSADGHVSQTVQASILAGQTTVVDIGLRLEAPCSTAAPDSLTFTILPGMAMSDTITLDNTGAGILNFAIFESTLALNATGPLPVNVKTPMKVGAEVIAGPASLLGQAGQTGLPGGDDPLSGWFSAEDHPEGAIRYAFAQCSEEPDSYYVISGVGGTNFGISNKTWRFDAPTNTWTELAKIPNGYEAPSATCYQGRIYVLGGSGSTDLQIYNIASDSWTYGMSLPRGVEGSAVGAWNGQIFMAGGDDDFYPFSGVSDQVDIYDIATDTWIGAGQSMPAATGNAGYTQVGPYLFVVGGWGEGAPDANVSQTQRYDMSVDNWELGPDFFSARADFALAATGQSLYAIAGDQDGGFFFDGTNLVEKLDLTAWPDGAWEDLNDPLPKKYSANQAGFCTQALLDTSTAEIWSVGGIDANWGIIDGRTLFRDMSGESCYSIYSDVPWLAVITSDTSLQGDSTMEISVSVDASGLTPGVYIGRIILVSNDPGMPNKVILVTLVVGGPISIYLPIISR